MNKVALVTGSSKGIGAAIVEELARSGYDVVINYNTSEKDAYEVQKKVEKYNVRSLVIKCDVSKEEEVKNMIDSTVSKLGSIDIVVNNAALCLNSFFRQKKLKDFQDKLFPTAENPAEWCE